MKRVEVVADVGSSKVVAKIAEKFKALDFHAYHTEDDRQVMQLLVTDDYLQEVLDTLQSILGAQPYARIVVTSVDAVLPKPPPRSEKKKPSSAIETREALYESVEKNVRLNLNYVLLVILSTVVAAIGLMNDDVAVVIGAMVIAPLLSPNLALGLATALGDVHLIRKSLLTNFAGIGLAIFLSVAVGVILPFDLSSDELISRTSVGLEGVILALASGAAAALSLTTGLSSVLVGVMVAVALLPPAVTMGLMIGVRKVDLAMGAALLLAVNLVCVNLAAKLVFFFEGIRPRRFSERAKARRTITVYILVWLLTLSILLAAIYFRKVLPH
ncbi:MAG: TIGR00341 family protein [Desulforhabdus sp.]|jgi:uncharacterized hydrophobic protein (TIGR00341 family)|nr:TIGR00341 family protein [Desulforhabdus sp.]